MLWDHVTACQFAGGVTVNLTTLILQVLLQRAFSYLFNRWPYDFGLFQTTVIHIMMLMCMFRLPHHTPPPMRNSNQWWLWRMMDVTPANQSQTPCQPWAGQNGWSPASPQGPPCSPLPSFQHLSLSSPSDHRPGYDHLQASNQGCQSDIAAFPPRDNTHQSPLHANNSDTSVKQITPDAHFSDATRGRSVPPRSLRLMNEVTQPCKPHQMPFYSPHSPFQAISSPFQPPYTPQGPLNGPQSPHQKHMPISSPSLGQCVNQSPQWTPQPATERANLEFFASYSHNHALTTSPVQQQPQWTFVTHSRGGFMCNNFMI